MRQGKAGVEDKAQAGQLRSTPTEIPSTTHRQPRVDVQPKQTLHLSTLLGTPTASANKSSLLSQDDNLTPSRVTDSYSSSSTSFDLQLGYTSPHPKDRVFPIRSVVSVDPTQTPFQAPRRNSGEDEGFPDLVIPSPAGTNETRPGNTRQNARANSLSEPVVQIRNRAPRKVTDPQAGLVSEPGKAQESRGFTDSREDRTPPDHSKHEDNKKYAPIKRLEIFNDATSDGSAGTKYTSSLQGGLSTKADSVGSRAVTDPESIGSHGGLVTARFRHMITEEGHAVITGRDGETLQRCEDEPIHIPGAVQGFGLLIAFSEETEGQLVARVVSENSKRIIGYSPQELFKLNSFTDILSEEQADNLLDHIDFIKDEEADPATNGPEVFTISIRNPKKKATKLWCAMHINPSHPEFIICEFELDDDQLYPLVPSNEDTPEPPEDMLHSRPTAEEYNESTQNMSKPLRVLRSARKRKGEAAAMEVFNIMSQVQEQLASAPNLDQFLKILVGVVKELTGFHRVMIYQFDSAFNGRVVTELIDPRATRDLYKGLNFPASDIPKQARDLYKINKVRLLYDRDLNTARLVCRTVEDLQTPVDLSFSYLRAMSPIHIKYLANMAVRSSMSISINAFGELWGLIACHTYGSKGMRVSFPIRKMCRLVGDTASRNIERLSYASRLQARKLINTVPTAANPSGYIIASSDDLIKLFDADFGLLSIQGETKILGQLEQSQEALAMLEYLRMRKITSVITSQDIKDDFPDLRYAPGFDVIAGLLLVPLSLGGADFIVFFRKGQIKEVKWAGNPYEKFVKEGTEGYLEPRKSFKTWSETVVGKCRDWTEEQIETAAVLCLVYGKFIEVWRQKEAALQSSQLTKLLLANSAHEVRTPLNAIINYLEIAMEGALDQETRENLAKSHSASKSLVYVINDLLDLTKAEEGQDLIKDEIFDLLATVRDATDVFKRDAKRKGIEYKIFEHSGIPRLVYGDQRRIRQAVSNITANAVQHTSSGWVHVELYLAERDDRRVAIEIVVQDTGAGMSDAKLDALFRDLEQVTTDSDEWPGQQLSTNSQQQQQLMSPKANRTLGLGLAMVARIVRNMDGQLRLKSEEGKGSRFVMQLPFDIPEDENNGSDRTAQGSGPPSLDLAPIPPPQAGKREVTLVDRPSSTKSDSVIHKASLEEVLSIRSFRSGSSAKSGKSGRSAKSDVDRLIDAISEPHMVTKPEPDDSRLQLSNSKGSGKNRPSFNSINLGSTSSRKSAQQENSGTMSRSKSYSEGPVPEHLRSLTEGPVGSEYVVDNKTMLRAVRMPDEFQEGQQARHTSTSRVNFDLSDQRSTLEAHKPTANHLQVLVAEDDPVNSRIIMKRLEKSGHEVHHTVNGEDCASAYGERAAFFDVVLMDMQMPIVDGLTSTKMIRSFEKTHAQSHLSPRATLNSRVPIFAVSASLVERECQTYIDAGFDGWILKPIDFKRLNTLLVGIVDDSVRNSCLYQTGHWERGGWFHRRQLDVFKANTWPSNQTPVTNPPHLGAEPVQPDEDTTFTAPSGNSGSSSGSGQLTPMQEPRRPLIYDESTDAVEQIAGQLGLPAEDNTVEDVSIEPDC